MMQHVPAETDPSQNMLVFYDSGCSTAVLSERAHYLLETVVMTTGPTLLDVAGGNTIKVPHGDERFHLELEDGVSKATITGLRMPHVTTPFPVVKLMEAWLDAQACAKTTHPRLVLPSIDKEMGGCEVDILLGIKYIQYFPKLVYSLPSGLQVYRAVLRSDSDNQAVLGGPHAAWSRMADVTQHMNPRAYLSAEVRAWYMGEKWVELNQGRLCSLAKFETEKPVAEVATALVVKQDHGVRKVVCRVRRFSEPTDWVFSTTSTNFAARCTGSRYLVDPCRSSWRKICRILVLALRFISLCNGRCKGGQAEAGGQGSPPEAVEDGKVRPVRTISDLEIEEADRFHFKQSAIEVKEFAKDVMQDLPPVFFAKTIVEKNSQIEFSDLPEIC